VIDPLRSGPGKALVLLALAMWCGVLPAIAQHAAKNDTAKVTITKLMPPLNTAFNDFAPVISADGATLMFTSNRPTTEREIAKGKAGKENIYEVTMDPKKKKWGAPELLSAAVNALGRNNSAIALSPDGQRMLVYRDNNDGNGNIFESQLNGTEWSELTEFTEPINSADHESSACYSSDGRTIHFVSDRKGGLGGKDIWSATRDANNTWGALKNMGPAINTKEDEQGIFLHADGRTLYFSSKGHSSTGGYDLFASTWSNGAWSDPRNLGAPLNTPGDDLYLVFLADGKTAYMSSVRNGGMGEKDLYEVKFSPVAGRKAQAPLLTVLKGMVVDEETKQPVEADIDIKDNGTNVSASEQRSNSSTGNFLLSLPSGTNYGISVSAPGYLFHSENFDLLDTAGYREVVKVIELKKLKVGKTIVLNNVFYDFDKATLQTKSYVELDVLTQLLKENPTLRIELGSHTDSKGSDDYNQKLSEARATSVVDYLISKSIAKDRLVAKGYGETAPVATNDTDEGRQLNRRTEFKVLE
jgi:outer membrane protein OmpA-like peptidoglycan-associated protein